jgi:uncharacterized membrane protein YkgB
MSLAGVIFGLLFVAFGVACVKWNYTVANNLREFDFISTIGGGDVYNGTKVLGVLCILFGFTIMLGIWQMLLGMLTGSYVGLIKN